MALAETRVNMPSCSSFRPVLLGALASLILLQVSCDDDSVGPGFDPEQPPATLDIVSPEPPTATVGQPSDSPLEAQVLDGEGEGVGNLSLEFTVLSGSGEFEDVLARTDRDGMARSRFLAGTDASEEPEVAVRYEFPDESEVLEARTTFQLKPGEPDAAFIEAGDAQTVPTLARTPDPLEVRVEDEYENPVPGVEVDWRNQGGEGFVLSPTVETDSDGVGGTTIEAGQETGVLTTVAAPESMDKEVIFETQVIDPSILRPSTIEIHRGDDQRAVVGESPPQPLEVRVLSDGGHPVRGVEVGWSVETGGGRVFPEVSHTNQDGVAKALREFGMETGGVETRAELVGDEDAYVVFSGSAESGEPDELRVVGGADQEGDVGEALDEPLEVLVADEHGNPIPNARVDWEIATGDGSLSQTTTTSDDDGLVQVSYTLGTTAGEQIVRARKDGLAPATFRFTAHPDDPRIIRADSEVDVSGLAGEPLAEPHRVQVLDQYDNPVPEVEVSWQVITGDGSVSPAVSETNDDGLAETEQTLGSGESHDVRAQVVGESALSVVFSVTAVDFEVIAVSGDGQRAEVGEEMDEPLVVEVLAEDSGEPIGGADVRWSVLSGEASVDPASTSTDASGRSQTVVTAGAVAGDVTVAAEVAGFVVTFELQVTGTGGAYTLEKVYGDNQTAGQGQTLDPYGVRVLDPDGFPAQGVTIQWAIVTGGGTLSSYGTTTNQHGIAQTAVTFPDQGTGTHRVRATSPDLADQVTFTSTIVGDDTDPVLELHSGDGQTGLAGQDLAQPVAVKLRTQDGTPLSGETIEWVVTSGGGTVSSTTTTTDGSGVASVAWTLGQQLGEQTLEARRPDAAGSPVEFIAHAQPDGEDLEMRRWGGNNQQAPPGMPLPQPLRVQVIDGAGVAVEGVTVAWAVTSGGGVVSDRTTVTDSDGIAEVSWHLGHEEGTQTVEATAEGVQGSPLVFEANATEDYSFTIDSGDGQVGEPGEELDSPYVVRLLDGSQSPVEGADIIWEVDAGGGEVVDPATGQSSTATLETSTDSEGRAEIVRRIDSGASDGESFSTLALAPSEFGGDQRQFTGTVDDPDPPGERSLQASGGEDQESAAGSTLDDPLEVTLLSASGDPVAGEEIEWSVLEGGGSLSEFVTLTGSSGRTSVEWTLGSEAGTQRVEAVYSGDGGAQVVEFTATATSPLVLTVLSAEEQNGLTGEEVQQAPTVRLQTESGHVVSGEEIAWTVQSGGGVVSPSSSTTDGSGEAGAQWTLGSVEGEQVLEAHHPEVSDSPVEFVAYAHEEGDDFELRIHSGDGQEGEPGGVLDDPLAVRVVDEFGVPVEGVFMTWEVIEGNGVIAYRSSMTDGDGVAELEWWELGDQEGEQRVRATAEGLEASPRVFTAEAIDDDDE